MRTGEEEFTTEALRGRGGNVMCPVCIATAAWIAGSTTSTGGLAVLIAKKFRSKKVANEVPTQDKAKENRHGQ